MDTFRIQSLVALSQVILDQIITQVGGTVAVITIQLSAQKLDKPHKKKCFISFFNILLDDIFIFHSAYIDQTGL